GRGGKAAGAGASVAQSGRGAAPAGCSGAGLRGTKPQDAEALGGAADASPGCGGASGRRSRSTGGLGWGSGKNSDMTNLPFRGTAPQNGRREITHSIQH